MIDVKRWELNRALIWRALSFWVNLNNFTNIVSTYPIIVVTIPCEQATETKSVGCMPAKATEQSSLTSSELKETERIRDKFPVPFQPLSGEKWRYEGETQYVVHECVARARWWEILSYN